MRQKNEQLFVKVKQIGWVQVKRVRRSSFQAPPWGTSNRWISVLTRFRDRSWNAIVHAKWEIAIKKVKECFRPWTVEQNGVVSRPNSSKQCFDPLIIHALSSKMNGSTEMGETPNTRQSKWSVPWFPPANCLEDNNSPIFFSYSFKTSEAAKNRCFFKKKKNRLAITIHVILQCLGQMTHRYTWVKQKKKKKTFWESRV